jgi:gas vesicle protein
MLPPDLAAVLKNMTVADLKSEMSAALEAIKNAKTPQELMDMLAKAMPKTLEVLKQIMKAIMPMLEALMQKIKDAFNALSDAAKKFLTELAQKVKDAAMALMEQLKKMLEKMGMDIKANLQAAITAAIPMAQMLFDLPMVKASLQITMSSG